MVKVIIGQFDTIEFIVLNKKAKKFEGDKVNFMIKKDREFLSIIVAM